MMGLSWEQYLNERTRQHEGPDSAVEVLEVNDERVVLDLPADIHDCDRVIPNDAVEFGNEASAWFAWDLREKQPRAPTDPHSGYAGTVKWGRDNVSWLDRVGGTFKGVLKALNGTVDGYCSDGWQWTRDEETGEVESPRDLYPMLIAPHKDFSPDPGLILIDLDDVVNVRDDGSGLLTREAWDIIQSFDAYAELSSSKTGVHVLVRGKVPEFVGAKQVVEDLEQAGHVEIRGYPGDGRAIGTTWAHIGQTPRDSVPEAQDAIDELAEKLLDDDEQLSDKEQARKALEDRQSRKNTFSGEESKSKYYDLNPERIASTGPFSRHGSRGRGPHPVHGGTSTPDSDSTNFAVDRSNGWKCWAHEDGGGALQLIAVIEGIRPCGSASDVMSDPVDALRVCLAARDKHSNGRLDDENPPTIALKGVLNVQNMNYNESGRLSRAKYDAALALFGRMEYQG